MKNFSMIIAGLMLMACGPDLRDHRTGRYSHIDQTKYITIATASVSIVSSGNRLYAVPGPIDTDITYVNAEKGVFELESGTIVPAEDAAGDNLILGTLDVKKLNINKLSICDPGGNTKCTSAIITIYTEAQATNPGVPGFVNVDDNYGLDITADSTVIGLGSINAIVLDSYTIPANVRRVRKNKFTNVVYDLNVDIDNAGDGTYKTDLRMEIKIGS